MTAVTKAWTAAAAAVMLLLACARQSGALEEEADDGNYYQMLLDVVVRIVEQDAHWEAAFDEGVYCHLDRTLYPWIVDRELLVGARDLPAAAGAANTAAAKEAVKEADKEAVAAVAVLAAGDEEAMEEIGEAVDEGEPSDGASGHRDAVRPMRFLRNVVRNRRHRIGSVLEMAVTVLRTSMKCVAYKHTVHLVKLIRVEISRSTSGRKATSRSAKATAAVVRMFVKMTALRVADALVLRVAAFLRAYSDVTASPEARGSANKFDMTPELDAVSLLMMQYVHRWCVRAPKDEAAVAAELGVFVLPELYLPAVSMNINNNNYKKMVKDVMDKVSRLFDPLPAPPGMPLDRWYELLLVQQDVDASVKYREMFRINRS